MKINDWENAQRLSDVSDKKWARCTDCDKWKKTTHWRQIFQIDDTDLYK